MIYYHVEGNTNNSFYPRNDVDYLYEGNINFTDLIQDNELFGTILYRATNDRLVDNQDLSLEQAFVGLRGESFEFLTGDFYSNFSEYSLANALKGLKVYLGADDGLHLSCVGGVDSSKWEEFWEERQEDSALRRYVWGLEAGSNLFDKKLALNFNYGGAVDDKAYLVAGTPKTFVNVVSIDGSYLINDNLNFSFEIAQSFTDPDDDLDSVEVKTENAYKTVLNYNMKDYSFTTQYSRIGQHFSATSGFTASDLETIMIDALWFLPKSVQFTHYFHYDRDNLSDHKSATTKQLNPGAGFSFTLPSEINCELGFDMRKRYSSDKFTNDKTYTYSVNFGKGLELFFVNLGYIKTIVVDEANSSQERDIDTVSLGLDGNFNVKDVLLSWDVSEGLHHEHYNEVNEADLILTHSVGLHLDFPSTLSIDARVMLSDNDYFLNPTDNNISNIVVSISRNLKDDLTFSANYEHRGYNYSDSDNNYSETIITGRLSYQF
ncbi:MAG: hypothetical protein JSW17_01205 [Candidatus Omnitrophota bacterium]|nr:MAG: hypothetical protein JSW17_01205 [Candidatus Omnitrophota bacterium]